MAKSEFSQAEPTAHTHGSAVPSDVPEPSLAEKARTLTELGGHSTLSTISRKHQGYPFGSVMPYGLTGNGEPIFLISSMAMHTRNLLNEPRATLLVTQESTSPLGAGRISIMGEVRPLESEDEVSKVSSNYLTKNPEATNWVRFGDFNFFQMSLRDIYFVGGFGVMGWITPKEFREASPDPLAALANGIILHMNEDHHDALVAMVRFYCGIAATNAEMISLDRLGFKLRVTTEDGMKGARIAFPEPVTEPDGIRQVFIDLAKNAKK